MAVNNSLTNRNNQKVGLTAYLTGEGVRNQILKVVGGDNGQRFISSIISAVQANKQLAECSNNSILSAALLGESLKLSPSPQLGQFYMVPYNNKGTKEAQFQLGYKGYLQLAIRSGQYKKINVLPIKEGELIRFDPLNEEIEVNLIEDEETRENAPTSGYYAMFEYTNGFRKAIYWSRAKMESHALKYSKGYQAKKGYTFWEKDFDAMACKTMIRHLISHWGVMSIQMQTALEKDMGVIKEDGTAELVDAVDTTAQEVPERPQPQQADNLPPTQEKPQEEPKAAPNDGNLF